MGDQEVSELEENPDRNAPARTKEPSQEGQPFWHLGNVLPDVHVPALALDVNSLLRAPQLTHRKSKVGATSSPQPLTPDT